MVTGSAAAIGRARFGTEPVAWPDIPITLPRNRGALRCAANEPAVRGARCMRPWQRSAHDGRGGRGHPPSDQNSNANANPELLILSSLVDLARPYCELSRGRWRCRRPVGSARAPRTWRSPSPRAWGSGTIARLGFSTTSRFDEAHERSNATLWIRQGIGTDCHCPHPIMLAYRPRSSPQRRMCRRVENR